MDKDVTIQLSIKPEIVAVWLQVPADYAQEVFDKADSVASRHHVERVIQNLFFENQLPAYVESGNGSVEGGLIVIFTDASPAVLKMLQQLFGDFQVYPSWSANLLPYVSLGWMEHDDKTFYTFYPVTTRPFFSLFLSPETQSELLQKGAALREGKSAK